MSKFTVHIILAGERCILEVKTSFQPIRLYINDVSAHWEPRFHACVFVSDINPHCQHYNFGWLIYLCYGLSRNYFSARPINSEIGRYFLARLRKKIHSKFLGFNKNIAISLVGHHRRYSPKKLIESIFFSSIFDFQKPSKFLKNQLILALTYYACDPLPAFSVGWVETNIKNILIDLYINK